MCKLLTGRSRQVRAGLEKNGECRLPHGKRYSKRRVNNDDGRLAEPVLKGKRMRR